MLGVGPCWAFGVVGVRESRAVQFLELHSFCTLQGWRVLQGHVLACRLFRARRLHRTMLSITSRRELLEQESPCLIRYRVRSELEHCRVIECTRVVPK